MLYDTHKRYGQVAALVMLPVAANTGVMEVSAEGFAGIDNVFMNIVTLAFYIFIAIKASMFGAEFPDLDSPGSTPAQKHKILAKLFQIFGVKHRGKFSHDFVTQAILWGAIYGLVLVGEGMFVTNNIEAFVVSLVKVYVFFTFVGVYSHLLADAMTADGVWFAWKIKVKFMPVFIRKVGIGSFKPFKSWFTTASVWNDMNYKFMTVMVPVTGLLALVQLIKLV